MAQARTDYGKVVAPRPFGGAELAPHRLDIFKYLMICMILFTVVSVFHVWSRCNLIAINLLISEAGHQLKEAEQEQKRLKLEVTSLKNPARIEMLAKGELGMALPTEQQVILVK
ncbi:MAG TPA: cell division protein FtsL [Desulfuromonadaceae bacterium]|jgi:cell division protein FtsL